MNKSNVSRQIRLMAVFACLALIFPIACRKATPGDKSAAAPEPSQLAKDMIGTWVHVGRPGQVMEAPETGGRLKFRTGAHWTLTRADAAGLVTEHFGGTYTLNGDEYWKLRIMAMRRG